MKDVNPTHQARLDDGQAVVLGVLVQRHTVVHTLQMVLERRLTIASAANSTPETPMLEVQSRIMLLNQILK